MTTPADRTSEHRLILSVSGTHDQNSAIAKQAALAIAVRALGHMICAYSEPTLKKGIGYPIAFVCWLAGWALTIDIDNPPPRKGEGEIAIFSTTFAAFSTYTVAENYRPRTALITALFLETITLLIKSPKSRELLLTKLASLLSRK